MILAASDDSAMKPPRRFPEPSSVQAREGAEPTRGNGRATMKVAQSRAEQLPVISSRYRGLAPGDVAPPSPTRKTTREELLKEGGAAKTAATANVMPAPAPPAQQFERTKRATLEVDIAVDNVFVAETSSGALVVPPSYTFNCAPAVAAKLEMTVKDTL
jgi:hypothetical protein